ncbi:hypothetical protein [Candidatus Bacteroides intestinigallinarum]|uniref:hypothetical protein n=1 Tax=Candidatus Bacteroides intestinigallinarum TaxID=2838470 RepID=UPI0022E0122B|nr:hypothetical protein [Candidatus Bacteroides intestinigallinarum]
MSKYSQYRYNFTSSVNGLADINKTLLLLKNAMNKRKEPVPKHIGNQFYNIKISNEMEQVARKYYDVALQDLEVANIIPTNWIPTYNELKKIAETADNND